MKPAFHTLLMASRESLSDEQAALLLAQGGQLVDIRSPGDFRHGSLPGARNLPMEALGHDHRHLDRHAAVILCGNQAVSGIRAARLLAGRGFERIYFLRLSHQAGGTPPYGVSFSG
jgi:rhodanese-related sulfurtransferase